MDKSLEELAVLFADVCGSTRLYEQYGDTVARADMATCLNLLSGIAADLGGETVKTIGDEVMCAFGDPVKAGLAAAEMQAGLKRASEDGRFKMGTLQIKIGWHFGRVLWRDDEPLGEAPVTAQQIIKRAKADEILTSRKCVDLLPTMLSSGTHTIGTVEAEGFSGALEICKVPWEQTGEETQVSVVPKVEATPSTACLVLQYDGQEVRIDAANPRCRIGRGKEADLRVQGNFVSRQHAEVIFRNGQFRLRDESVNGCVLVGDTGTIKKLRREEGMLAGRGTIGFGAAPAEDPQAAVEFRCCD